MRWSRGEPASQGATAPGGLLGTTKEVLGTTEEVLGTTKEVLGTKNYEEVLGIPRILPGFYQDATRNLCELMGVLGSLYQKRGRGAQLRVWL